MNIVKLQQQLQNVPDNALIGYVQNPTGQVPSYLALTELNRRKAMREDYQQQAAPEKSVAEGMVEGVAGLPISEEMFTAPETGIAATEQPEAFADGGEVKHYAGTDGISDVRAPDFSTPKSSAIGRFWENIAPTPYQGIGLDKQRKLMELMDERSRLSMGLFGRGRTIFTQENSAERQAAETKLAELDKQIESIQGSAGGKGGYEPTAADKAVTKNNLPPYVNPAADNKAKPDQKPPAPGGAGDIGIGALKYKPIADNSAAYDQFQRPEQSAAEKMAEMQALIGEDAGKAGRAARLAKMEERTAKDEETAPWMALAKAGFGIASGKSPFALSNIGEGAQAGLADLAASRDRINNAKDKQFEIADRMAQAERAEKVAAAKYGVESSEAIKARNEQNKLAKLGYQNQRELSNYNREFEVQKGNADIALQKAKMAQDAAQHAQTIAMYDKRIAASGGAAQARLVESKRKAYLDAQTTLAPEIASILKKKYNGNSDDPMFQRERQMLINGYVSNALSLTMDDLDARDSGSL